MATVPFTTVCDVPGCGERAMEYSSWPTCRECQEDICLAHAVPGSVTDADLDSPPKCLCQRCAVLEA